MRIDTRSRLVFAGFALVALALLAEAMVLQHLKGQAPCPLCVLQRAGYVLVALIALVAAIHQPRRRGAAGYCAALALAALAGLGVAIRHVWVLYHPKFGCGIDVLAQFVNDLPTAKLLPWLFHASGECTAPHAPILGLQVPEWSLIWFSLLFLAALIFAAKCLSAARTGAAT
ncbi:MAG: disulfide bond formation protein B [Burkholderiales bacterium]|nr:disulfide bond formation protein B [Burkholderiales bacterium]